MAALEIEPKSPPGVLAEVEGPSLSAFASNFDGGYN
jgi:hypothetical protein